MYATIAVPESRLVTSVLLRIRYVTSAVTVLSIDSPFFYVESTIIHINFSMLKYLTRKLCFTLAPFIAQAASDWLVLIDIVFKSLNQDPLFNLKFLVVSVHL